MPYTKTKRREYDKQRYRKKVDSDHAEKVRKIYFNLRVPEQWVAQFQRLAMEGLARGTNPWKTSQEVCRAMIVKGFEAYHHERHDEDIANDDFMPQLQLEQQLSSLERSQRTAEAMLGMARRNIRSLLNINAEETAQQYYGTAMDSARELPASVWQAWLVRELEKAFPELAKEHNAGRTPGIKLRKGDRRAVVREPEKRRAR